MQTLQTKARRAGAAARPFVVFTLALIASAIHTPARSLAQATGHTARETHPETRGEHDIGTTAAAEGFVFESIVVDGVNYPYAVYRPRGLDALKPSPALVFLHGSGECGTDGSKQLAVGLGPAVMLEPARWPFVIVFPQKPTRESEWEDHAVAVMAMLDREIREQHVDADRVAITGLSQGGHGTVQIAAMHANRFRAAAPVCAYINRAWAEGRRIARALPEGSEARRLAHAFRSMPVWLFHGERDTVVPAAESRALHAILTEAGLDSTLTVFPDDGHNAWDSAYRTSGLWDWLVEQTR
jgi:predicted peptidase